MKKLVILSLMTLIGSGLKTLPMEVYGSFSDAASGTVLEQGVGFATDVAKAGVSLVDVYGWKALVLAKNGLEVGADVAKAGSLEALELAKNMITNYPMQTGVTLTTLVLLKAMYNQLSPTSKSWIKWKLAKIIAVGGLATLGVAKAMQLFIE